MLVLFDPMDFLGQSICVREGRMKPANKEQFKHKVVQLLGFVMV